MLQDDGTYDFESEKYDNITIKNFLFKNSIHSFTNNSILQNSLQDFQTKSLMIMP